MLEETMGTDSIDYVGSLKLLAKSKDFCCETHAHILYYSAGVAGIQFL